jgi:hypothetical protein
VNITISKKYTLLVAKLKLPLIKRSEIRLARASEDAKRRVVGLDSIQFFKRSRILDHFTWCFVDEESGRNESLISKFERHGCSCQERKTNFNDMSMFSLNNTILLVRMRARDLMSNTHLGEEVI